MTDENTKLTDLFVAEGLTDIKGFVFCGLIEKLYKFSILNNKCKQADGMPIGGIDSPQERFQDSINFYRTIWDGLVQELKKDSSSYSVVEDRVITRIKEMEEVLDSHRA